MNVPTPARARVGARVAARRSTRFAARSRSFRLAALAVAALTLSACAGGTGDLRLEGDPDGYDPITRTWCMGPVAADDAVLAPLPMRNVGDGPVTITAISADAAVNAVVDEFAVVDDAAFAGEPIAASVSRWDARLEQAWIDRDEAVGARIDAGDTALVLVRVRTLAGPQQTAGVRGFTVEFNAGAGMTGRTVNDVFVGFHPVEVVCDADQIAPRGDLDE